MHAEDGLRRNAMRKFPTIVLFGAAMSCAEVEMPPPEAPAPPPPPTAQWDDAAAQELRAELDRMNKAFETGDMATARSMIAADGALDIYDFDAKGNPIRYTNADDMFKVSEQMMGEAKAAGIVMQQEVKSSACQATETFGACTQEFDMHMTTPDGHKQTWSFRGTGTARRGADGWKWTHWHASFATLPPPPQPPAPPAIPPASYNLKKLKWAPVPNAPKGFKVAVVWEHPTTKAQAAFVQFPRKTAMPKHRHSPNIWMTVVKGALTVTGPDGKAMEIKAGGYAQAPAGMVHTTESKKGAIVFQLTDGPMDTVMEAPAAAAPAKK
jgi:quercetin dioxygenase-like cupin family protein/ketosteroid isomerase-like protein